MAEKLSKRQQEVYDYIKSYIEKKDFGPTVREIAEALNLSSPSTVHVHLKNLEEKGYITRDSLKSRSIALTNHPTVPAFGSSGTRESYSAPLPASEHAFSNTLALPLVGRVAAGEPILAEENIEDTIVLPTELVGDNASFILSVHGNSMIEAGINDGDWIVVKQQQTANNGEIIVALLEDGATVKRFYKESDHIRLQPENSSLEPIIVRECAIVGKVVAVMRRVY